MIKKLFPYLSLTMFHCRVLVGFERAARVTPRCTHSVLSICALIAFEQHYATFTLFALWIRFRTRLHHFCLISLPTICTLSVFEQHYITFALVWYRGLWPDSLWSTTTSLLHHFSAINLSCFRFRTTLYHFCPILLL